MLLISNGVSTGFNDFYPNFSSIYVRNNHIKICSWNVYDKWLYLLLIIDVGFLALLATIYLENSTFPISIVYISAILYIFYVALRQYIFRKSDFKLDSTSTVTVAPFRAWLEQFLHGALEAAICISAYALLSGFASIVAMIVLGLSLLFLFMPVLNFMQYKYGYKGSVLR